MARPRSRVRPLEAPGNRRPREMIVVSSSGDRLGEQNPAYRPSLALLFLFSRFRDARSGRLPHAQRSACHGAKRGQKGHQQGQTGGVGTSLAGGPRAVAFALQAKMHVRVLHDLQGPTQSTLTGRLIRVSGGSLQHDIRRSFEEIQRPRRPNCSSRTRSGACCRLATGPEAGRG